MTKYIVKNLIIINKYFVSMSKKLCVFNQMIKDVLF